MKELILEEIETSRKYEETPIINNINFDLWTLTVTLHFKTIDRPVYVKFESVEGFRALDEGGLIEYWSNENNKGWLWKIENGWYLQETKREGFTFEKERLKGYYEYMVAGTDLCLSVISLSEPKICEPSI